MTIEERFSQSLDVFYRRKEREKFLCCKLSMSTRAVQIGMRHWEQAQEWTCEACGALWERGTEGGWNLIVGGAA